MTINDWYCITITYSIVAIGVMIYDHYETLKSLFFLSLLSWLLILSCYLLWLLHAALRLLLLMRCIAVSVGGLSCRTHGCILNLICFVRFARQCSSWSRSILAQPRRRYCTAVRLPKHVACGLGIASWLHIACWLLSRFPIVCLNCLFAIWQDIYPPIASLSSSLPPHNKSILNQQKGCRLHWEKRRISVWCGQDFRHKRSVHGNNDGEKQEWNLSCVFSTGRFDIQVCGQ